MYKSLISIALMVCLLFFGCRSLEGKRDAFDDNISKSDSLVESSSATQKFTLLAFSINNLDFIPEGNEPEITFEGKSEVFSFQKDGDGGYQFFQAGQPVGSIHLVQDPDHSYFEKCKETGENLFVNEITDLTVQVGRNCVKNTIHYPSEKNTGEKSSVKTDFYFVSLEGYCLRIQASNIPAIDTSIQYEIENFISSLRFVK